MWSDEVSEVVDFRKGVCVMYASTTVAESALIKTGATGQAAEETIAQWVNDLREIEGH